MSRSLPGAHADRPHCIYRGFCLQGCKVGAKASTLYTHIPDGITYGAEVREKCMVAHATFNLHENDKKMIDFGKEKVKEVMWAAGAVEVVQESRYAHLVGAARMGSDPRTSVVDGFGQSHDIPNLFISDGSIFPTQGSANPGLTIMALAARTADYLLSERVHILARKRGSGSAPPVWRTLSPAGTSGRGVPRYKGERVAQTREP